MTEPDDGGSHVADNDLLLPEGSRLLHIGLPKTGTTTIQGALKQARPVLAEHGVEYPGTDRQHWKAARAVLGTPGPKGDPPVDPTCWDRLVRQVSTSDARRVVVSAEAFSAADGTGARTVVRGLGGSAVHVVVTLRPLAKMLPSIWQQSVRQSLRSSYEDWLDRVLASSEHESPPKLWQRHRQDLLVSRWAEVVGAENLTVVVVDDSDREMLIRVFERMLGLPHELLEPESRTNPSLSYGEVEFVRHLNRELHRRGWSPAQHRAWVRKGIVHHLQGCRRPAVENQKITTPQWAADRIATLGTAAAERVAATGVRVVGDVTLLASRPTTSASGPVTAPDALVHAQTAAQAVVGAIFAGRRVTGHTATRTGTARASSSGRTTALRMSTVRRAATRTTAARRKAARKKVARKKVARTTPRTGPARRARRGASRARRSPLSGGRG